MPWTREQMAERARMNKGRPKSEETKAKMSAAQKGRPKSPEHLAAIRAARAPGARLRCANTCPNR